jgi:hypothetical protein
MFCYVYISTMVTFNVACACVWVCVFYVVLYLGLAHFTVFDCLVVCELMSCESLL